MNEKRNLTMLMDYYELTMSNGYFCQRTEGYHSGI